MIYTNNIQAQAVSPVIDPYDKNEAGVIGLIPELTEVMIEHLQSPEKDNETTNNILVLEDVTGDLLEEMSPFSKMFEAQQRVMVYTDNKEKQQRVFQAIDELAWSAWVGLASKNGIDAEKYQEDYSELVKAILVA